MFNKNNSCFIKTSFWHSHIQTKPMQQPHEVNETGKRGIAPGRAFFILSVKPVTQAQQIIYQQVCAEIRSPSGVAQLLPVLLTNCIGKISRADQPADPCPLVFSKDSAPCQENPIQT